MIERQRLRRMLALVATVMTVGPATHPLPAQSQGSNRPLATVRAASGAANRSKTRTPRRARRSPALAPLLSTSPFGTHALNSDLSALLRARVKKGSWGVLVTSVSRGDTLFSHQADAPLMPASTQKLFTTVLAFERLGPWHQLTTDILRTGPVDAAGTLHGSLVLRGGGDPALNGRFLGGSPEAPVRALAEMVANAGVKRVSGDVIGDASAFEAQRIPDGWLSRYLEASYATRVSALSLNSNLLHVAISPLKGRATPAVTLRPELAGIKVVNQARVTGAGRGAKLSVSRSSNGTVFVKGWIGGKSGPRVYTVVVDDPSLYTTAAFRAALQDLGVTVDGTIRTQTAPTGAEQVARLSSPPLVQLTRVMNGESDNHFAELLLRAAARGREGEAVGSARLANEQLRSLLSERAGVVPQAIDVRDGSGLSSLNRITARALTNLLMYASRAPWAREFEQTLPVAGTSETLRHRMLNTPAQGNLHAKTGTTNDVVSLGGYVTSRSGERLAFAMFYNGRERFNARATIDAMGATLAGFSR